MDIRLHRAHIRVIASYSGDASFLASSSGPVAFTVGKGAPFVVVGANSNSIPTGQSLGVHAVVSGSGTAQATGTVQFTADGVSQGQPVALQVGGLFGTQAQASAILTNLTAGTHTIGAIYNASGDLNYVSVPSGNGANESTFSVTVGTGAGATSSSTALAVATQPVSLGDMGAFNVSVTPAAATGTVTLWDAVGPRSAPVNISGGSATIQLEWTQGGNFSSVRSLLGGCEIRGVFEQLAQLYRAAGNPADIADGARPERHAFASDAAGDDHWAI